MEKREQQGCSKKAKVEELTEGHGRQDAENGALALLPAETQRVEAPRVDLTLKLDRAYLHCPICTLPLKPPIFRFQCAAEHLACNKCYAELPKHHCYKCGHIGCFCRNITLENVVGSARIPCPYKVYGCRADVVYHEAAGHQRACGFAPCGCPEEGCPFVGSPSMLRGHIAAEHPRFGPILSVPYGFEWNLTMEQAQRWQAFFGQEDGSVFLVSQGELGGATTISLVCVRANGGAPAPQYKCRVVVVLPGGDNDNTMMVSKVRSSALSGGAPAPDHGAFVGTQRELLSGESVWLRIRIDPLPVPAAGAAAGATPNSAPPDGAGRSRRSKWQR